MAASVKAFSQMSRPQVAARMSRSSLKVNAYKVTLEFPNGRTKSLEVQKETSVLDAVDAAGVDLPYLCRTGMQDYDRCSLCLNSNTCRIAGAIRANCTLPG